MMTMLKKNIITIAGKPGSGKSTTSKKVASELNYKHFSSGDLFRAIGKEMGIDLLKANKTAENENTIDHRVDSKLEELGENENEIVIDSRTAWHWIPQSFKVYLDLDLETAAERIISNIDKSRMEAEHIPETVSEYVKELEKRLASETKRYSCLYNIDPYNKENYDLVINTSENDIPSVVEKIITGYHNWLKS